MTSFIYQHRNSLIHTMEAIKKGKLTIGFIGGSITDGRGFHNWPESVAAWFVEKFPDVQIVMENAGIGATGSDLAVFRVQRDLIDRGCDLVFVEFAANDIGVERVRRRRTQEGLFRKLLSGNKRDVVTVYTYIELMCQEMLEGKVPENIEDYEVLCEHYDIGSVWMSRYAMDEVLKGRMKWEQWLPDGLHPRERGSLSYGTSVINFLEKELSDLNVKGKNQKGLPKPLDPLNWENTSFIPLESVCKKGPWLIRRSLDSVFMDQILSTSAPGSKISFEFEGRVLVMGFDFGKKSAEVKYSIDGGETITTRLDRTDWMPESSWLFLRLFSDFPESRKHTFEMESVYYGDFPKYAATRCEIAFIGVVP